MNIIKNVILRDTPFLFALFTKLIFLPLKFSVCKTQNIGAKRV